MFRRSWPDPQLRSAERGEAWMVRTRHFLSTDPGGCWVAEDADGMVGFATSYTRELMWILATYAVRPQAQGQGIGKALLAGRAAPRPGLPARDALLVVGPEGAPALPAGRLLPASADVPVRHRRPVGDPGDREGPARARPATSS